MGILSQVPSVARFHPSWLNFTSAIESVPNCAKKERERPPLAINVCVKVERMYHHNTRVIVRGFRKLVNFKLLGE